MFHITTTLSYGLRVLVNLAQSCGNPKSLKQVAAEEEISLLYLRKVVRILEKAALLKGRRGPGGGFVLTRKPQDYELSDIIKVLSVDKLRSCLKNPCVCKRSDTCRVKGLWREAYSNVQGTFIGKTLANLVTSG